MEPTGADDGMQQERTTLAWRRTGLALAVVAILIGRLTVGDLGSTAVVLTTAAAGTAAWMALATVRWGSWSTTSTYDSAFDSVLRDGRAPAVLAGVTCLICLVELAAVIRP